MVQDRGGHNAYIIDSSWDRTQCRSGDWRVGRLRRGCADRDVGRPAAAVAAVKHKTKVPGHQVRIVLAGNRLGQPAKIRLVGVKGRADGVTKVVKVKTTKRVKHLRSGG